MNPVVITADDKGRHLVKMKWGLVPPWSKEPKSHFSMINARAETVAEKPTYRKSLLEKRCLVPATGYFEWAKSEGKQPYRIEMKDPTDGDQEEIVSLAGLYEVWHGKDGEELPTYTIITAEATAGLRGIHNRMPVILTREAEEVWLDPSVKDVDRLVGLLKPYPEDRTKAYKVGTAVNSPGNDWEGIIQAL